MKGVPAGFIALLTFFLVNVINQTSFALSDVQSAILMLLGLVAAVKWMEQTFPNSPPKRTQPRQESRESPDQSSPEWGTCTGPVNPDQGQPEHDTKGL